MWTRKGQCKRCGNCCKLRTLIADMKDFPEEIVPDIKCHNIFEDKTSGKAGCVIYSRRPDFCQAYPAEPADLIDGCGFWFERQ